MSLPAAPDAPAIDRLLVGPSLPADLKALTGETLVELLERAAERTPEATALVIRRGMQTERWSYRLLVERSRRVAATLARHGVEPGSRVVTWAPNDPWLVAAYFGAWYRGALVVPLDLRMKEEVAERIGRRTEPALVLAGPDLPDASAIALGAPVLRVGGAELDPDGEASVPDPLAAAPAAVTAETHCEILFTSGTTSDPKGVVLSHGQMIHNVRVIAHTAGIRRERGLALIPLSHMYGQMVPLLYGLLSGSQIVFLAQLTPSAISQTLRRERITAITVVPQLLRVMLDAIESEAARAGRLEALRRLRRLALLLPMPARRLLFRRALRELGGELRVLSCGGAKLPADLQLAWEAMGIEVIQGYGATECAAIAGHSHADRRPGTVGPPLAGMEVRIAPDGELLARGPNAMVGYWQNPEATAEALAGGWVHTGDAAAIDEHGELIILGRTRDRIALPNGLKVYPEDVELALRDAGGVAAAVVFEIVPGRLAAVLVPARAADATDEELDAAVRAANAALAPHQRVRQWRRWPGDDFPRTHTLKVRRPEVLAWARTAFGDEPPPAEARSPPVDPGTSGPGLPASPGIAGTRLRTRLLGERLLRRPPAPAPTEPSTPAPDALVPELASLVAEVAAAISGGQPPAVDGATDLEALGFDSLSRVTLALRIEEAFDAALDDDDIAASPDVAALAERVLERRGAPPPPGPSRWAFSPPARLARRLLDATFTRALVNLAARPSAEGLEHLDGLAPPYLICPNHASHLDAPSVRHVLPARVRDRTAIAAAADYFFSGSPLGPIVALGTGAFPFGRTEHVRASLERLAGLVDKGWNVIVFPEGTRSRDGSLGEMREGIGLLATSLGVPIVPVHVAGAHAILPKGRALPRRRAGARVRVRFGAPLAFEPGLSIHEATRRVGEAIRALAEAPGPGGAP